MKRITAFIVIVALVLGLTTLASADTDVGFRVVNMATRGNRLIINGYIYNSGNVPIKNIHEVELDVYVGDGEIVASGMADSILPGYTLNVGDGTPYSFAIDGVPENLNVDNLKCDVYMLYDEEFPVDLGKGIKVFYNGTRIDFDVQPILQNNRTMVPIRAVAEAMGAEVGYISNTKQITIKYGDTTVKFNQSGKVAYINDVEVPLDAQPVTKNSRTMVPLRFVAEAFNSQVFWGNADQIVTILK